MGQTTAASNFNYSDWSHAAVLSANGAPLNPGDRVRHQGDSTDWTVQCSAPPPDNGTHVLLKRPGSSGKPVEMRKCAGSECEHVSGMGMYLAALSDAPIVSARIAKRNKDGSGVVEVPITVKTPRIDFSRTEGGGPKSGSMTLEDLKDMERNFGLYDAPVTVGFDEPGMDHDRNKGGASDAFMEYARMDGERLLGGIWVSKDRLPQFEPGNAKWRGYSIEGLPNKIRPSKNFKGLTLTGGIFTNTPALSVNYKIAASEGDGAPNEDRSLFHIHFRVAPSDPSQDANPIQEAPMPQLLEALGVKTEEEAVKLVESKDQKIKDLEAKIAKTDEEKKTTEVSLSERVTTAEKRMATAEKKTAQALEQMEKLAASLRDEKAKRDGERVRSLIAGAIDPKVGKADPAEFDLGQYKDGENKGKDRPKWDKEPESWLAESAYTDADQLERILSARVSRPTASGTTSGKALDSAAGTPASNPEAKLLAAALKLAADKKMTLDAARQEIRLTDPALYQEAIAARYSERTQ